MPDVRFHCAERTRRSVKRSKHHVGAECPTAMRVLALNPAYGEPIAGFPHLRKIRLRLRKLRIGKRGGYRCIYRKARVDEVEHIVFLEVYFKGDVDDLTRDQYALLDEEAEAVLADPLAVEWEDPPGGPA